MHVGKVTRRARVSIFGVEDCCGFPMDVGIIVPAAGSGQRLGGAVPKQYRLLAGTPVLVRVIRMLRAAFKDAAMVVAVDRSWQDHAEQLLAEYKGSLVVTEGGSTRQESVFRALQHPILAEAEIIVIHDAVRPFASVGLTHRVVEAARQYGAAVPVIPPADTVKLLDANGTIETTLPRGRVRLVQTPQAFRRSILLEAHQEAAEDRFEATDDASIVEYAGYPVVTVEGEMRNIKITTPLDWCLAEQIVQVGCT